MTEELNQPQQPPASTNPGPNPNANPGGGGGGRRRRRRRSKKGGGGGQMQGQPGSGANGQGQQHAGGQPRHQHKHSQHRKQHAGQANPGNSINHNQRRGRSQRRGGGQPFVGPMDHSYRNGQVNGNVADNYRPGRPLVQSHFTDVDPIMNPVAKEGGPARIFCFIEDLFFLAKIQEVARKLGISVEFVKTVEPVLERAGDEVPEEERPALVIVDLNNLNAKPLTVIEKLRKKLKKSASIIGFVSHVRGDLKLKAQEAGCDMVMPRSAFSQNLPNLLRRHSEAEEELHEDVGNR